MICFQCKMTLAHFFLVNFHSKHRDNLPPVLSIQTTKNEITRIFIVEKFFSSLFSKSTCVLQILKRPSFFDQRDIPLQYFKAHLINYTSESTTCALAFYSLIGQWFSMFLPLIQGGKPQLW